MHELVHLDLVISAREHELNQLFISTQYHKAEFIKGLEPTLKKLSKLGISDSSLADYCSNLFEGMNRQIFNTPIDLFIEDFLYNEFSELRPYQFMSLYTMTQEGIKSVTDKRIIELSPKEIISKSKIYNLVNALQFRNLYGIDLIREFNATSAEIKHATNFYDEYLQYKDDKEPAEEYELVLHWAEDLNLEKYFELVNEKEFRSKRVNINNILESIEKDPYDLISSDPTKARQMEKFQKSQQEIGTNMAVVMYMVDALKYFEDKPKSEIKNIAMEIAMQGIHGYRPDKESYRVRSIPGKTFSGYHILAYYYVSWALAIPEMLSQLQLPYDDEYKMALTMYNPNKK